MIKLLKILNELSNNENINIIIKRKNQQDMNL